MKFNENEVYKKGNKYLGISKTRAYINNLDDYEHITIRVNKGLKEHVFNSVEHASNWLEDNNHINDELRFTNKEMVVVLALFDQTIFEEVYNKSTTFQYLKIKFCNDYKKPKKKVIYYITEDYN
jgi:hypothetical protein